MGTLPPSLRKAITAAKKVCAKWDGMNIDDVTPSIVYLANEAKVYRNNVGFSFNPDDIMAPIIELLNEKSIWPPAFVEEACQFAIASDATGRYLTWDFAPDSNWVDQKIVVGRFDDDMRSGPYNLTEMRKRIGIRQIDLANMLGVSPTTVNRWESTERSDFLLLPKYALAFMLALKLLTVDQRNYLLQQLAK